MPDNSRSYLLPNPYFVWRMLLELISVICLSLLSVQVWVLAFRERQPAGGCMENQTLPHRCNLRADQKQPSRRALRKRLLCPDSISPFLRQKSLTHWDRSMPNCVAGSSQGVSPLSPPSWTKRRLKFGRKHRAPTHPSPKGSVLIQVWFCMYLGRKQKKEKVMISSAKGCLVLMTRGVKRR